MAESEISILIRAVDDATRTLNNVRGGLEDLDKGTKSLNKTQESSNKTFQESTNSLIAVGNAVSTVDNIVSSYQNLQIRTENAELRLIESRQSLQEQTQKLNGAQVEYNQAVRKYGENSSQAQEAAAKLRQENLNMETAVRRLEIAQNNLARAQNAVFGSMLNIGVQSLGLIATLPTLIGGIQKMAVAMGILNLSMAGAVGIAIAIAAVVAGLAFLATKFFNAKDATTSYVNVLNKPTIPTVVELKDNIKFLNDELDRQQTTLMNARMGTEQQLSAWQQVLQFLGIYNPELEKYKVQMQNADLVQKIMNGQLLITRDNYQQVRESLNLYFGRNIDFLDFIKTEHLPVKQEVIDSLKAETDAQRALNGELEREIRNREELIRLAMESGRATGSTRAARGYRGSSDLQIRDPITGQYSYAHGNDFMSTPNSFKKYNDFLFRPGQKPISFSPDDTIIGAKGQGLKNMMSGGNKGSIQIYIEKVVGVDAQDIADALQQRLFTIIPKL